MASYSKAKFAVQPIHCKWSNFAEIETTGKEPDFTFDIKEPEYVTLDPTTNVMTAVQQGETTVGFLQWDEIISEGTFLPRFGLIMNSSDSFTNFELRIYDFCNEYLLWFRI